MLSTRHRVALVASSAILGIAAFPPWGGTFLALVAWAPLLRALRGVRPGRAMLWGFAHGLLLFGGTLPWLGRLFGLAAVPMIGVLAAATALFAALYAAWVHERRNAVLAALGAATLWTGIEHYRAEWFPLAFPWITPGTALPPSVLSPWIGTYGVSFAVLFVSGLLVAPRRVPRAVGVLALGALVASLAWPVRARSSEPGERFTVALVQAENAGLERLLARSLEAGAVDAIVWPELALGFDPRGHPRVMDALRALLSSSGAKLLVLGCRTAGTEGSFCNTALFFGREGSIGAHVKNRPVPFLDDGLRGTATLVVASDLGPVAAPICFDLDASEIARRAVAAGAEVLLVPSKDPAWWGEMQHVQHAALARHRAAETGRFVAVAASSGRTQVIDSRGATLAALPLFEQGVLVAEVGRERAMTFYVRWGWMLAPACTALTGLSALAAAIASLAASSRARRSRRASAA